MKLKLVAFALATLLGLCSIPTAVVADEVVALGSNGHFVCYLEDEGDGFFFGTIYLVVEGELDTKFARKFKLKRFTKQIRRAKRRAESSAEDTTYYDQILTDLPTVKQSYRSCRSGDLASGGGSGDDDDDDESNGGGGSGGGGGSNSASACAIATGDFSAASTTGRIVNGTKCTVTANTPTVQLSLGGGECTGTVIASNVVLTASHCTSGVSSAEVITGNGTFQSSAVYTHPGYSGSNNPAAAQDIAIIVTTQDMGITPAAVYGGTSFTVGEDAFNAGYGLIDPTKNLTDGLYATRVNIVSSDAEQVTTSYQSSVNPGDGTNCPGDSGGAFWIKRSSQWVVGAVVSNGTDEDCGITGNEDLANFTITGNPTNKQFILQYSPSTQFIDG